MKITDRFILFYGSVFSQWAATPFQENGKTFSTAEQYMMYHKAMLMGDIGTANAILDTTHPDEQKALGRKIKPWNQALWDEHKFNIVLQGNLLKFAQVPNAFSELMLHGKGRNFVEASPYDKIWGIGLGENDPDAQDPQKWKGENLLGKVLDEVYQTLYKRIYDEAHI